MTTTSAPMDQVDSIHVQEGRGRLRLVEKLVKSVARGNAKARQRNALAELDDRLLRDIGLTAEQAMHEASKPFWK